MAGVIVAPETRELGTLARQIAGWLQERVPGARDVRVENLSYPLGAGQSHETILLDASWSAGGARIERGCVVRIKPVRHTVYPDDLFEEQYRVMAALHRHDAVRVAEPLWLERDPTLLGAPFFVMARMRGRVPVSIPPYRESGWVADASPAERRRMWENGVRQLAAIQHVPLDAVAFLAGPEGARNGLEQEWAKYVRFARWVGDGAPHPIIQAGLDRLRSRWPANQPPGLVWGDARIGNMMFDENFDVVAVMDWEQPSLGGALHDLAWWLVNSGTMHGATATRPHLAGMGTRDETIALWRELTGIATDDLEWYEDFTNLKMGCLGVRMGKLKGKPMFDDASLARRLKVG